MNPLITAAFFMEGLHDAQSDSLSPTPGKSSHYDTLLTTWDQGCIELVDTLVSHVPLTLQLCEAAAQACDGDYPGVFDYEVSSCFGRWFGEQILQQGEAPSCRAVQCWLMAEIRAFFTQSMTAIEAEQRRVAIGTAFASIVTAPHTAECK